MKFIRFVFCARSGISGQQKIVKGAICFRRSFLEVTLRDALKEGAY